MRRIERTSTFKCDYKREAKGPHRARLDASLIRVVTRLASNKPLSIQHRDHALADDWKDYRDCHFGPDLVLI